MSDVTSFAALATMEPKMRAEIIGHRAARQLLREVEAMGAAALAAGETLTPDAHELLEKIRKVLANGDAR